ncbi:MAG: peptide-methionine (S)-S-oxide reductase MsrA [Gallionella sp.]|nr:peptide-methionine (S)-S-oxide reductase MsrA [Gallionella sp.]PIR10467.1 MAG: peptide-methionine (S)-S-oxide reductase [Gallionellaceae bacterium CG11_big_fil_rev_8_21_14_0_20_60_62]PIV48265.1 MAG: peptide-methionine (S)-S-oxide reductase [Gallionellaceae bacterium CG02_land_8_20_14_3_00_60_115]PIY05656.1 MAG: peptide-methionine (S)-S-oxide reductase [Gallionellaceae bacterium CG_4_10_14_3_um_filter_60_1069]PJC04106.1 MAG: peptide-methionine (S)-S-oxide reductase [Gallionellaceae bacterium 
MRRLFLLCALLTAAPPAGAETKTAIFAGGCFWCLEADFEKLNGVIAVESGYTAGHLANPTYRQVSAGGTGHAEAVRVTYDAAKVGYDKLLDYFWRHIDPTVKDRQFCDSGSQYRSGIYFQNAEEEKLARAGLVALEKSGRFSRIYTEIEKAGMFYPAEEYHQDYYKKNPLRYGYYRRGCGRDARVEALWSRAGDKRNAE